LVSDHHPTAVVIDPISNLVSIGDQNEVKGMLARVIDFLKSRGITAVLTSLEDVSSEQTDVGISSLMDTWLLLRNVETSGERNRLLFVLKSRGMAHSNQVREFELSDAGIQLTDVYTASGAVLTGSARLIAEARERSEEIARQRQASRRRDELQQLRREAQSHIEALQAKVSSLNEELQNLTAAEQTRHDDAEQDRGMLAQARQAD
jgi:circadian clock protein KaiC